jgi:hypothetical protein
LVQHFQLREPGGCEDEGPQTGDRFLWGWPLRQFVVASLEEMTLERDRVPFYLFQFIGRIEEAGV